MFLVAFRACYSLDWMVVTLVEWTGRHECCQVSPRWTGPQGKNLGRRRERSADMEISMQDRDVETCSIHRLGKRRYPETNRDTTSLLE